MIPTSEWCAEHLFAGPNTQHKGTFHKQEDADLTQILPPLSLYFFATLNDNLS